MRSDSPMMYSYFKQSCIVSATSVQKAAIHSLWCYSRNTIIMCAYTNELPADTIVLSTWYNYT